MSPAAPRLELKSTQLPALLLPLRSRALGELAALMQTQWGGVAGAFEGEPLCLDVNELPAGPVLDWPGLVQLLQGWGLRAVAVRGAAQLPDGERQALVALGLVVVDGEMEAAPAPSPAAAPPPAMAAARPTLVIDRPLRSGQQVYARDADLIVLGLVSHGAEVIADGHIHVYGALRGRAIAGARGNAEARIFAHSLEAELVSVVGTFRTAEKPLPPEVFAKPAQVRLDGERLVMEPLKF